MNTKEFPDYFSLGEGLRDTVVEVVNGSTGNSQPLCRGGRLGMRGLGMRAECDEASV